VESAFGLRESGHKKRNMGVTAKKKNLQEGTLAFNDFALSFLKRLKTRKSLRGTIIRGDKIPGEGNEKFGTSKA